MKADRRWWNDGRYVREVAEFKRAQPVPPLTRAEREFVRRLVRLELEKHEQRALCGQ